MILLVLSIALDYYCAQRIYRSSEQSVKKLFLGITLLSNFGLLGFFKYQGFFVQIFNDLTSSQVTALQLVLPIGISFYIFHTVSYVVDVYRGRLVPKASFWEFLCYVTFFPQLIAGPIERAGNILSQIPQLKSLRSYNWREGGLLFFQGLCKKLVIADTLSIYVEQVFGDVSSFSLLSVAVATFFFGLQIYADFSGYTDMARGLGKLLHVRLTENFKFPYWSQSIQEFWGRWHITLSTWLRDYLYISLSGNKKGQLLTLRNLMITMLLGGIWHGANYTFLLWGFYHGLLLIIHRLWQSSRWHFTLPQVLSWGLTFSAVFVGWFFFRAQSIHDIWQVTEKLLHPQGTHFLPEYKMAFFALSFLTCDRLLAQKSDGILGLLKWPAPFKYAAALGLLIVFYLGRAGSDQAFIYFQF